MGLSLEEFQKGVASVGSAISQGTDAWLKLTGKQTTVATPTVQPASPSAPTTTNQGATAGGLASIPPWLLLAGGLGLVFVLSRKRG
jgi:hypothetical protein